MRFAIYLRSIPIDRRRAGITPEVHAKLASQFDSIELEQHLDFLDGTAFRRTLLCRNGHTPLRDALARDPAALPLDWLLLASPAQPLSAAPELDGSRPEEFVARKNRMTASLRCDRPIEKTALAVLGEIYPRAIPLEELLAAAATRLGRATTAEDRTELRALIAGGFPIGVIELHRWQPSAVNRISQYPEASPVARYELSNGWAATTLWHDRFVIDDPFGAQLVINLDGHTDRATLIERLTATIAAQESSAAAPIPHWLAVIAARPDRGTARRGAQGSSLVGDAGGIRSGKCSLQPEGVAQRRRRKGDLPWAQAHASGSVPPAT